MTRNPSRQSAASCVRAVSPARVIVWAMLCAAVGCRSTGFSHDHAEGMHAGTSAPSASEQGALAAPREGVRVDASSAGANESPRAGRLSRASRAGRYHVSIRPEREPAAIGPLHAWIVEVQRPDGAPAEVHQLVFDGGMPAHDHGFETRPTVTDVLGPGIFRVDGVRFHMAGEWTIQVRLLGPAGADDAIFELEILL